MLPIVLAVVAAAVVIFLIIRYVRNKDEQSGDPEAYPQTTSVRTNIQSASPTTPEASDKTETDKPKQ